MKEIIKRENIWVETAPAYTPQMNGVSERINRTIIQKVTALLIDSGLPQDLWELAMRQVIHIHNRLPHKKLKFKTSFELFTGRKPVLNYIRRFGSVAYRKNQKARANKFGVKGQQGIVVGSHPDAWLFLMLDESKPNDKKIKIIRSSDLEFTESLVFKDIFDKKFFEENSFPTPEIFDSIENEVEDSTDVKELCDFEIVKINKAATRKKSRNKSLENSSFYKKFKKEMNFDFTSDSSNDESSDDDSKDFVGYERRYRALMCQLSKTPEHYGQVKFSSERAEWEEAIQREINSQLENET